MTIITSAVEDTVKTVKANVPIWEAMADTLLALHEAGLKPHALAERGHGLIIAPGISVVYSEG